MTDENTLENEDGQVLPDEAAPEGETPPETATGDEGEQQEERPVSRRDLDAIAAQLRREREERERERAELRAWMESMREPEKPMERPKIDDYETEDDYHIALADWRWEARERERQERERKEAEKRRQQEFTESLSQAYQNMHQAGSEKYADYWPVIQSAPLTNPVVGAAIARSELSADVSYYLGKNHEVARKLDQMEPMDAAREIGRIESLIAQPKHKPVSGAPAPTRRETATATASKPSGALTPEERIRRRQAELAGKSP